MDIHEVKLPGPTFANNSLADPVSRGAQEQSSGAALAAATGALT